MTAIGISSRLATGVVYRNLESPAIVETIEIMPRGASGHRDLHVLNRHRSVHEAEGFRRPCDARAMLQFFKPENYFTVREALLGLGEGI